MKVKMQAETAVRLAALQLLMNIPGARIVIGDMSIEMENHDFIVRLPTGTHFITDGDEVLKFVRENVFS